MLLGEGFPFFSGLPLDLFDDVFFHCGSLTLTEIARRVFFFSPIVLFFISILSGTFLLALMRLDKAAPRGFFWCFFAPLRSPFFYFQHNDYLVSNSINQRLQTGSLDLSNSFFLFVDI